MGRHNLSRPRWTSSTRTPSARMRAGDRRAARRTLRGARRRSRHVDGDARDPRGRDDRGRRGRRSTSPAPRRSTTGTSTARSSVDAVGLLLRRARASSIPTCPRRAARSRPSTVHSTWRAASSTRGRRLRSPPATSRRQSRIVDVVMRAFGAGDRRARAGAGHDEQRHASATSASRTTRRSAVGRVAVRGPRA